MAKEHTARVRCQKVEWERWSAHAEALNYDSFSSWARRVLNVAMESQRRGILPRLESMSEGDESVLVALLNRDAPKKPRK